MFYLPGQKNTLISPTCHQLITKLPTKA